jgi:hypothetical protein
MHPRVLLFVLCLGTGLGTTQAEAAPKKKPAAVERKKPGKKPEAVKPPRRLVEPPKDTSNSPPAQATRGPTRLDFDDRLIQGQTNKSGAVYLYDRKELKNPSMVRKRDTFREEIVNSVYGS